MSLAGKTMLMSGGSRGIGLAIALRAARDGANIALLAKTDTPHPKLEGTIHTAADAIREAGGNALPVVGDVRNDEDIARIVRETVTEFGGIDIVVNNASAIDLSKSAELKISAYDLMQDINVRGTFMLTKAALPYLRESVNPHILSLAPPVNATPKWLGAHTAYSVAKFGMAMVTLGFAAEFSRVGIGANTLWPRTTIATAAVRNLLGGDGVVQTSRTPEIVADAAYLVLISDARLLSGKSLIVEEVLERAGITDLSRYAVVPGTPDHHLTPDIFLDH